MNLNTIKEQLEPHNYYVLLVSDTLIVGAHPEEKPDSHGIGVFQAFCSLEIQNNTIILEYGQANLPKEEKFPNTAKAVDFIKKMFPI